MEIILSEHLKSVAEVPSSHCHSPSLSVHLYHLIYFTSFIHTQHKLCGMLDLRSFKNSLSHSGGCFKMWCRINLWEVITVKFNTIPINILQINVSKVIIIQVSKSSIVALFNFKQVNMHNFEILFENSAWTINNMLNIWCLQWLITTFWMINRKKKEVYKF